MNGSVHWKDLPRAHQFSFTGLVAVQTLNRAGIPIPVMSGHPHYKNRKELSKSLIIELSIDFSVNEAIFDFECISTCDCSFCSALKEVEALKETL